MTARTDGAGTTAYGYDVAGRLSLTDDPVTGARTVMSYDAAGRVTTEEYRRPTADGSGWTAEGTRAYTYDTLGRLAEDRTVSGGGTTALTRLAYGYDADDRLVRKETEGTAGSGVQTYTYDLAGRMTSATNGAVTTPYAWDAAGNRTLAGTASAQYDERNRLLSDGTNTYAYTARGTLASVRPSGEAVRTLTFDAFERKVTDGTSTYQYDSLDRVTSRNGMPFVYDGGSNNLVSDGTSSYTRTPGGTLIAAATGTTKQRLLTDRHTDVVAALTADGTAVSGSTSYDPFGKPQAESGTTPSLGYQSGYTDPDNGDINMAARWYQPGTGAFASRDTWQLDPTQSSGRAHRYSYGFGSPLNGTDPTGHAFPLVLGGVALWDAAVALGGATVGVSAGYGAVDWAWNQDWSWSSSSSSSSSSRGGTNVFSNAGAASAAAAALSSAALRFGTGGSSSTATSRSGSGSRSAWYPQTRQYWSGSWTYRAAQPQPRVITAPPRPPIPQNPNKGKHPVPAPTRPTPKPDWGIKPGGWKPSDGWKLVVGTLDMLDVVADTTYEPEQAEEQAPEIAADYGMSLHVTPEERSEFEPAGESPVTRDGCTKGNTAVHYMPLDDLGRAQGVRACLNKGDYNYENDKFNWAFNTEPTEIVGTSAEFPIDYKNHIPEGCHGGGTLHRGHLLARRLGGEGHDLRNLVPLYAHINTPLMKGYEEALAKRVEGGETIYYQVIPHYPGSRKIPDYLELSWVGNIGGPDGVRLDNVPPER